MKKTVLFFLGAVLIAFMLNLGVLAAATNEFSADVKISDANGNVTTGKIYMQGNKMRQEVTEQGEKVTTIIRLDKNVSWTLLTDKQYLEMKIPFDPAHPASDSSVKFETKTIGTETVNGYVCQVVQYTYKDKSMGITIQWVADKLGFAIKTQTKDSKGKVTSTIEYTNIKTGKQADSLFEVPAGFQKVAFPF